MKRKQKDRLRLTLPVKSVEFLSQIVKEGWYLNKSAALTKAVELLEKSHNEKVTA